MLAAAAEINLSTLTPAQLASIMSQLNVMKAGEEKRKREHALMLAESVVGDFECETFASGARGVSISGVKGDIPFPDGTVRNVTVSILVRVTDTIPARKVKAGATKGHPVTTTTASEWTPEQWKRATPEQRANLRRLFDEIDADGDEDSATDPSNA
jgi:hypothetical protein